MVSRRAEVFSVLGEGLRTPFTPAKGYGGAQTALCTFFDLQNPDNQWQLRFLPMYIAYGKMWGAFPIPNPGDASGIPSLSFKIRVRVQ